MPDPYAALRKSVAEATDGPWRRIRRTVYATGSIQICQCTSELDAQFIAAADPPTIRSLLEERDRLAEENEELRNLYERLVEERDFPH